MQRLRDFGETAAQWAASPEFYTQLAAIAAALVIAWVLARVVRSKLEPLKPAEGLPKEPSRRQRLRSRLYQMTTLIFPLLAVVLLAIASQIAASAGHQQWLIRVAEGIALVSVVYTVTTHFISNSFIRAMGRWIGIPVAALAVFGWLDNVTGYLDNISLTAGNIRVSLYVLLRTLVLGAFLFWLGRLSNTAGKDAIRRQQQLDAGTREVFAKLFEIAVFVLIFLLLLQVMGINLTALAVFGGALGVGLGFGLQQIAANFISGIIILLDRSLAIGDHVELEDGRSGTLRELNMRFGVLETYDGKDIVVPNEKFITSSYTNWTHKDPKQRYAIEFQVAYSTDLEALFEDLRALCSRHPQVLSGDSCALELRPDAEIAGFGDSGIDILIEFWMEAIDDGVNRVGADLLLDIYRLFKEKGYQFPFPQREVRVLGDAPGTKTG